MYIVYSGTSPLRNNIKDPDRVEPVSMQTLSRTNGRISACVHALVSPSRTLCHFKQKC